MTPCSMSAAEAWQALTSVPGVSIRDALTCSHPSLVATPAVYSVHLLVMMGGATLWNARLLDNLLKLVHI